MKIPKKEIQAVLFDLDGTLVDSMWMWGQIDVEYLARYGLSLPPGLQREIEGMSFSETAVYFKETFSLPDSLEEIKAEWNRMAYEKYRYQVSMKPFAREFLEELREQGIPMGIATSNSRQLVDAVLDGQELTGYFTSVRTACEVAAGKPAPDIYLRVAQDLGVEPRHCLVFEDVPAGIQAGKNAGMWVCSVYDRWAADMEEEKRRLADDFIMDYSEVLEKQEVAK